MSTYSDETVRRYLLHSLDEEEHAAIELALLTDDLLFERVGALEAELLEDCFQGDLETEEAAFVQGVYDASASGRERLRLAADLRGLANAATGVSPERRRVGPWLAAAGGLAVVIALLFALWPRPANRGQQIAKLQIVPTTTRAAVAAPIVSLLPGTTDVELELILEQPPETPCEVIVASTTGTLLLRSRATVQGGAIVVRIPSDSFEPGEYRASVALAPRDAPIATYSFRVEIPDASAR